ncbi:epithelial sodium channel subunit gamma-like [Convolutriloba macropyga]|uniref:epithelial sodium channel subunit gamma-like n=1 Tax=Convolutriloba macropyga TaxID=536237 RepID=UPI003F51D00B
MLNMLPTFKQFFIRCLWKGEDCLNGSSWSTQQTTGIFCHKLTLADSEVYGSFETLQLTFLLDLESASATGKNDLQVELYFLMPGKPFSVQDHKIMTKVGPGYHHNIGLEIFKYDDNSGKTRCLEGNARGVLDFHEEYTYALCVDECVTIKEQSCGCNSLRYARPDDDIPDCGIFDMVICPFDSGVALGQCAIECKPQCSFTTYEIFKKSAKFSSVSSFNTMRTLFRRVNPNLLPRGNLTFDLWRQRVFDVNVHFRSLLSTHISVTLKYSFIDIISAFGGLGGLFIGASLVTLVEICFLLYDLIQAIGGECVLAWGKSRKKKVIPKA